MCYQQQILYLDTINQKPNPAYSTSLPTPMPTWKLTAFFSSPWFVSLLSSACSIIYCFQSLMYSFNIPSHLSTHPDQNTQLQSLLHPFLLPDSLRSCPLLAPLFSISYVFSPQLIPSSCPCQTVLVVSYNSVCLLYSCLFVTCQRSLYRHDLLLAWNLLYQHFASAKSTIHSVSGTFV